MSERILDTESKPLWNFDYQPRTRIVFGVNVVDRAGALASEIGAKKILLVTDPGIVAAGHAARVRGILESAGLEARLGGVISIKASGFAGKQGGLKGRGIVVVHAGVGRANAERATAALIVGDRKSTRLNSSH